jgi:hypothetical protein
VKNLERLVLSNNQLTTAGVKALQATGVAVEAKDQYKPGDDEEYLWQGDIE